MSKDYYKILGVERSASEADIKKAFRRLAHEYHPDKGGDQQKFKDINEAYQVLGDKDNRAKYDQFGSAAFEQGGFSAGQPGGGFGGFDFNQGFTVNMEDFGDLGDILGGMFGFGGRGTGNRQKRGRDLETEIQLDFLESIFGVDKEIHIYLNAQCEKCKGTGAEEGSNLGICPTCGGQGRIQQAQHTIFGIINTVVQCPTCNGLGKKINKPCKACKGTGIEKRERVLTVKIPPGMSSGEALKVSGQGDFPGVGGKAGDLFVRVKVKPHTEFTRHNHDILSTKSVPYSILTLGGAIDVNTVDGPVSLKIPSGTSAGTVFKLRGKGIPFMHGYGRGDHLITVIPDVPKKLSKEQKKLLEELQKEGL